MGGLAQRTIVVFFAGKGGIGDAGKFATMHALKQDGGVNVRPVALYSPSEGKPDGFTADVNVAESQARLAEAFNGLSVPTIDVESSTSLDQICDAISGADAVVACVGSRQPSTGLFSPSDWKPGRWSALGARQVISAMKKKEVQRLVILSSFGFGDDPLKSAGLGLGMFWRLLLKSTSGFRAVTRDVKAMEVEVRNSELDYLMLRPVGLDPDAIPRHKWDLISKSGDGSLGGSVAKEDVGACMVQEALHPTQHAVAMTIGYKSKK